jgi:hypothetical protein
MELSSRSPLVGKTKLMDSQLEECLNFLGKKLLLKTKTTILKMEWLTVGCEKQPFIPRLFGYQTNLHKGQCRYGLQGLVGRTTMMSACGSTGWLSTERRHQGSIRT